MWHKLLRRLRRKQVFYPIAPRRWWREALPSADLDYEREAGDPMLCSVVAAAVGWIARNVAAVRWRVLHGDQPVPNHPVLELLSSPNDYMDSSALWYGTIAALLTHGNAYWYIEGDGEPRALWWAPPESVEPVGTREKPIVAYRVRESEGTREYPPEAFVHLRYGLNLQAPWLGDSPLKSLYRAIAGDNEAQTFGASLLRNLGIIGLVIAPKQGTFISPHDQRMLEREFAERFTREGRGRVYIPSEPVEVQLLQHDFAKLDISPLTNLFEERICAVLGIPPMVLHLGAGTEHATYSNAEQAYRAAWESFMAPLISNLAGQITQQLLPRYGQNLRLEPDWNSIPALTELAQQRVRIYVDLLDRGVVTVAEVRRALGLPTDESHDILLLPLNRTPVEAYLDGEVEAEGD